MTAQSITLDQKKRFKKFVNDTIDEVLAKIDPNKDKLQSLIDNNDKFKADIIASIKKHLMSKQLVSSLFSREEISSDDTYPNNYAVKPLAKQIVMISKLFNLNDLKALTYAENLPKLPEGAEGWFAIPKWQAVADTYGKAVEKIFALIAESRKFKNWCEGELGEKYLRLSETTEKMFTKFCEKQEGDIIIISAQFGLRHRGRSVRRAREVFANNEFGLGAFAIGAMLLTHPEREQIWDQLHINCSGDEYNSSGFGGFVNVPLFYWRNGELVFYDAWMGGRAVKHFGSASGFVPQN